jgi:hypothetical protein
MYSILRTRKIIMMKSILALAVTLLLCPSPASATSCAGPTSVKQAFASSGHVFSAYVEDIHTGPAFGRDNARLAKLQVLQVWKGELRPGDTVEASAEDSISFVSDGFVPAQDSSILVYTSGGQPYVLHTCSRTAPLDSSTNDLPVLDKLFKKSKANP